MYPIQGLAEVVGMVVPLVLLLEMEVVIVVAVVYYVKRLLIVFIDYNLEKKMYLTMMKIWMVVSIKKIQCNSDPEALMIEAL